jgi:hypothetical protein
MRLIGLVILALSVILAPLVIPKLEALDVHLNGLPVADRRGNPLDHELLRDGRVASVARAPGAWTTPDSRNVAIRQPTIIELLADE